MTYDYNFEFVTYLKDDFLDVIYLLFFGDIMLISDGECSVPEICTVTFFGVFFCL